MKRKNKPKSRFRVVIRDAPDGAEVIRPDKTRTLVRCLDEMVDEALYVGYLWPGAVMVDRRGWTFPGEA